jgi:hypothetical protein
MKEKRCPHCGAVNVARNGTCLTFKSDGDVHFYAESATYCGRCRSCLRSFKLTLSEMMGKGEARVESIESRV